jgi:F-type H+-transporting ATPase subunit epsilon
MTLQVEVVIPEGEIWAGPAQMVIAKTLDGDIGVLTGHTPVLGILAEGSVVRIMPEEGGNASGEIVAAVGGGFFSVADDRVSVLARQAQLGREVDRQATQNALNEALQDAGASGQGDEESTDVRYFRAQLRAAGDSADRP